jgi:hypothetical protein
MNGWMNTLVRGWCDESVVERYGTDSICAWRMGWAKYTFFGHGVKYMVCGLERVFSFFDRLDVITADLNMHHGG